MRKLSAVTGIPLKSIAPAFDGPDVLRCWDPHQDEAKSYIEEAERHLAKKSRIIGFWRDLHMMITTPGVQQCKEALELKMLAEPCDKENVARNWRAVSTQARKRYLEDSIELIEIISSDDFELFCQGKGLYTGCPRDERLRCLDRLREFADKRSLQLKVITPAICAKHQTTLSMLQKYRACMVIGDGFAVERTKSPLLLCHTDEFSVDMSKSLLALLSESALPCPLAEYEAWVKRGADPSRRPQLTT